MTVSPGHILVQRWVPEVLIVNVADGVGDSQKLDICTLLVVALKTLILIALSGFEEKQIRVVGKVKTDELRIPSRLLPCPRVKFDAAKEVGGFACSSYLTS